MRTVSRRGTSRGRVQPWRCSAGASPAHHGLHRHRLDHQRLALHQEGEALAVGGLERRHWIAATSPNGTTSAESRALVAHVHAAAHAHLAAFDLLAHAVRLRAAARQRIQPRLAPAPAIGVDQRQLDRLLADHVLVGQAHAVGRQHAGQRVHEHPRHAQRVGHPAGVLAAGTAEALQRVARDVVAPRHRDLLDRIGHLLHGDVDEAFGHLFGALRPVRAAMSGELASAAHRLGIQRLIGRRAEHLAGSSAAGSCRP